MKLLHRIAALAAPLLLTGCLVTPGNFTSSLDIRADRSFRFTYQGEVIASKMDGCDSSDPFGVDDNDSDRDTPGKNRPAAAAPVAGDSDATKQCMEAIVTALAKEKGFNAVRYLGNRKFMIDYAIAGRLDHAFLFPFNSEAQILFPFVAVELRGNDRVRVTAPGFANMSDKTAMFARSPAGKNDDSASQLNGSFTLTTDAEIISQNQEDGAQSGPQGKTIVWKVTPATREAPAATLRVQP